MKHQYTEMILREHYLDDDGKEVVYESTHQLTDVTFSQHRDVTPEGAFGKVTKLVPSKTTTVKLEGITVSTPALERVAKEF